MLAIDFVDQASVDTVLAIDDASMATKLCLMCAKHFKYEPGISKSVAPRFCNACCELKYCE